MILDAGPLIAVDRGEHVARSLSQRWLLAGEQMNTTAPVLAQVWRNGGRQARLARFLRSVEVHDFTAADAWRVGDIVRQSSIPDVVDAHVLLLAVRLSDSVLTADTQDFRLLASHMGNRAPRILHWP